jgi:hypothetical protein
VATVDPDSTGLNPAWRSAVAHVLTATTWPEGLSSASIMDSRENVLQDILTIASLLPPDAGSYFNEVGTFSPMRPAIHVTLGRRHSLSQTRCRCSLDHTIESSNRSRVSTTRQVYSLSQAVWGRTIGIRV